MAQQEFSESQEKKIKNIVYGVLYGYSKDRGQFISLMEKNLLQKIDNSEATQRIIVERIGGIRSLVELNYKEILNNRQEILENRRLILERFDILGERINDINSNLTTLLNK